jgi:hypothetical protein
MSRSANPAVTCYLSPRRRAPLAVACLALALGLVAATTTAAAHPVSAPAWIAYIKGGDVYVIDPQTRQTRRLTTGHPARWLPGLTGGLSISPDEREVAFTTVDQTEDPADASRTIAVVSILGGRPRDVTPWPSVGFVAKLHPPRRTHIDPHWIGASRLDYTDDQESNGQSRGVAMTLDLRTGRRTRARVPQAQSDGVIEPFVAAAGFAAFPVLVLRSSDCSSTLDLVRSVGTREVRLTYTPFKNETPLDVDAHGNVLALRSWVTSGAHNGLCLLNGTGTIADELIVERGEGRVRVLHRFAPVMVGKSLMPSPPFDAAFSPDGQQIAHTDQSGNLTVEGPNGKPTRLVNGGVTDIDW